MYIYTGEDIYEYNILDNVNVLLILQYKETNNNLVECWWITNGS